MSLMERYRDWFEQERDANDKMLTMIESVPEDRRSDPKFGAAIDRAAHIAACRENWLDRMNAFADKQVDWFPHNVALETLRPRYGAMESAWIAYLADLTEEELAKDFEFPARDGNRYRWNIEGQIIQLVGHAFYHRGQVSMLVDELGGETVDTDYLFWAIARNQHYGRIG